MSRRILQVLVGFAAIQAMLGGGLYLTQRVAGLSFGAPSPLQFDPTDPAWTRVDYMYRAMAGIWFALGLMFAYMAPSIERHSTWFALACTGIFGMGVGRYLSSVAFPQVPENSTVAMIAELVIPPIYVLWQRHVARTCGSHPPPKRPPNKALQQTSHSVLQSISDTVWHRTVALQPSRRGAVARS